VLVSEHAAHDGVGDDGPRSWRPGWVGSSRSCGAPEPPTARCGWIPISTETIAQLGPDGHSDTGKIAGYKLSRAFEVRSGRVKEITDIVQKSSALLTEASR